MSIIEGPMTICIDIPLEKNELKNNSTFVKLSNEEVYEIKNK